MIKFIKKSLFLAIAITAALTPKAHAQIPSYAFNPVITGQTYAAASTILAPTNSFFVGDRRNVSFQIDTATLTPGCSNAWFFAFSDNGLKWDTNATHLVGISN